MKPDSRFTAQRPKADDSDDWLVTFADMATLMLAFFVLLASISKVDVALFEQVKAGLAKGISNRDVSTPLEDMRRDIRETVRALKIEDVAAIGSDHQGLTIEFTASAFYDPGSAEVRPEAIPILNRVAVTLLDQRYIGFQIEVQGHTDDTPIATKEFPTNWELSAARATRVVRLLAKAGISEIRLRAVGLADTAPKVANRGPGGEPLPQNQEINRRVVLRIYPR